MVAKINADVTNGVVITSDTSGELELQANGVTKAKVTANGLQDANGNSITGGMYRNLIINGDMQIAQRGTSKTGLTGAAYNTVDRFFNNIAAMGTWTNTQDTNVPTGQGFSKSYKLDCTTANGSPVSGAVLMLMYGIEGQNLQHLKYGTSSAETLTVSFWVKSNKTGSFIAELQQPDASNRHINKLVTINSADTWEKKTITFAGDTSGTINNDNGKGLSLNFWLAAGTDYTSGTLQTSWGSLTNTNRAVGGFNLADSTSNYINITGVQLEVGEGASDFEFLPYDVQLAMCQRYYQQIGGNSFGGNPLYPAFGNGFAFNTTQADIVVPLKVTMRTTPTITAATTAIQVTAAGYSVTSIADVGSTFNTLFLRISTAGTFTAGQGGLWQGNNSTASYAAFSAEL